MTEKTYQAKPDEVLEKEFMDPSSTISVHESTWWARDEIKSLRKRLEKLERENWKLRKESDFWVDLLVSNANSRFFSQEYTESSESSDE